MNRDTLRLFVTAAFAFSAILLYQRWVVFSAPENQPVETPITEIPEPTQDIDESDPEVPIATQLLQTEESELPLDLTLANQSSDSLQDSQVAALIKNDSLTVGLDKSGAITLVELLRHSVTLGGEPLALLINNDKSKYIAQTGLIGSELPNHRDPGWQLAPLDKNKPNSVTTIFTNDNITVERSFELAESGYLANYIYRITNNSTQPLSGRIYFQYLRDNEPPIGYSSLVPSYYGAALYTEDNKYSKYAFDDFEGYPSSGTDGWIGIVQRYFLAAWLDAKGQREYYMNNLANGDVRVGLLRSFGSIAPGDTVVVEQPMFLGALEQKLLEQIAPQAGQGISLAVDYGILTILCAPLFSLLSFIHGLVGNWGIAIMLLTLLIKLAFFPLSAKSYRSMAKMKALSPQIQRLRERAGEDRQAMQKEIMALYKKEKINPFGGCLPILVQIPVFIALYWVLLESVELRQAPLGFWLQDLSIPDPYYVLPIILCVVMLGQFKLNPTPPDPTQAMVMKIMPIGFAIFAIFFPAGLVIYWIVNTILSIAQQWQITRSIGQTANK